MIVVKLWSGTMTKILIIPDIHNRFYEAEGIIMRENPDHTVFLGDYFNNYGDAPEFAYRQLYG